MPNQPDWEKPVKNPASQPPEHSAPHPHPKSPIDQLRTSQPGMHSDGLSGKYFSHHVAYKLPLSQECILIKGNKAMIYGTQIA